jgi:hypothetical protein
MDQLPEQKSEQAMLRPRLQSVLRIPAGEVDDTRFEKYVTWFHALMEKGAGVEARLVDASLLCVLEAGFVHKESRVVACVVRWLGLFAGSPAGFAIVSQSASTLGLLASLSASWFVRRV